MQVRCIASTNTHAAHTITLMLHIQSHSHSQHSCCHNLQDENGKDVYRSYTPVSDDEQLGSVDFVIKVRPQGAVGVHLAPLHM